MNKKIITFFIAFKLTMFMFGQAGTSGDPYTSLGQAWFVSSDGIYHFNIGGTTFSTYVEAGNGWILVASGSSATTESSYPATTTLTLQSDRILPVSIYTSTSVTDVRMNATSGSNLPFDVQSSNATVLTNLQNDRTLSVGTNNTDWSGSGTARLTRSCASRNNSLSTHIYHACGETGNLHWQVGQNTNHERVAHSSAAKNDLNLWIRTASVPLPIVLLNFSADVINNSQVELNWQTASEINNNYFTVERSLNGIDWEIISIIDGAGNSSSLLSYSTIDKSPFKGVSYYRLKQTDFDGQFEYSRIRTVSFNGIDNFELFPNPANNRIIISRSETDLTRIMIYNTLGQDVTWLTKQINENDDQVVIDLSKLDSGIYYLKTKTSSSKFYKK